MRQCRMANGVDGRKDFHVLYVCKGGPFILEENSGGLGAGPQSGRCYKAARSQYRSHAPCPKPRPAPGSGCCRVDASTCSIPRLWISRSRISPMGLPSSPAGTARRAADYPYSVAEHSLLVEDIHTRLHPQTPVKWRLAALLHDAPEYVIGDMISPVKAAVGPGYGELDARLAAAIHLRFGLPAILPKPVKQAIKKADRVSAWLEAVQIAGFAEAEADRFFGRPDAAADRRPDPAPAPPRPRCARPSPRATRRFWPTCERRHDPSRRPPPMPATSPPCCPRSSPPPIRRRS